MCMSMDNTHMFSQEIHEISATNTPTTGLEWKGADVQNGELFSDNRPDLAQLKWIGLDPTFCEKK